MKELMTQKDFPADMCDKDKSRYIRKSAMGFLARREHGKVELQRKLQRKFNEYDVINEVLYRLETESLLSDERFTESYTRYRSRLGFGPQRILMELREKGISDSLAQKMVYDKSISWEDIAVRAKVKKFGAASVQSIEAKARLVRFLQYRGFGQSYIERVV